MWLGDYEEKLIDIYTERKGSESLIEKLQAEIGKILENTQINDKTRVIKMKISLHYTNLICDTIGNNPKPYEKESVKKQYQKCFKNLSKDLSSDDWAEIYFGIQINANLENLIINIWKNIIEYRNFLKYIKKTNNYPWNFEEKLVKLQQKRKSDPKKKELIKNLIQELQNKQKK